MEGSKKRKIPATNSVVRFDSTQIPKEYREKYPFKEFKEKDTFLFLGEIAQAPGHCCVINIKTGKFYDPPAVKPTDFSRGI